MHKFLHSDIIMKEKSPEYIKAYRYCDIKVKDGKLYIKYIQIALLLMKITKQLWTLIA